MLQQAELALVGNKFTLILQITHDSSLIRLPLTLSQFRGQSIMAFHLSHVPGYNEAQQTVADNNVL